MANTLKLGAGKWATGTDTVLAFNDENNNFKPLPFDFSRASSATVVNQSGLIETVGSGEPRIDFKDNTKGALLLEPQRTNLILYSQDFSNASWNTSSTRSVDFAPTSTTDPEGKTNAYRVTSTASNNQVAIFGSIISGQVYTNSIYVRRVSGSGNIILRNVNNEENNFQLSVSDGWKRIETTATSTSTFGRLYINLQTVGDVIEIWGGQVEQGSYPTSYIPTSGSAVTRVYDTMPSYLDVTPLNIGNSYTLFLDADLNVNDNNKVFSAISNSIGGLSFTIRNNVGGIRLYNHIDSGYPVSGITSSTNKFVIRVDGNLYKVFVQGSSLSGTLTTQRNLGSLNFNGQITELKINNFTIDNTALSDAECEALVN